MDEILKLPESQRPSLCKANLAGANLTEADLTEANLTEANLTEANLTRANLSAADLTGATLFKANLTKANLTEAEITGANLTEANLIQANLTGAYAVADITGYFAVADLTGAVLAWANLTRASLPGAHLNGATLFEANLTGANLTEADLTEANLTRANLAAVDFEPNPQSLSSVVGIEYASGLDRLRFRDLPTALVILRERFAKAGLRDQERQVNFAKLRAQQIKQFIEGPFWRRVEAGFSYFAFDLTCAYGLDYGRPLRVLGAMVPILALVYTLALRGRRRGAIWRLWKADRILEDDGQAKPERLSWESLQWPQGTPRGFAFRLCRALGLGLLFSLLSAFQIGWREFNVGNWITRLLPREYTLQATGWVRVVSGVQSLFSVYLLALWALTYFGRPFE